MMMKIAAILLLAVAAQAKTSRAARDRAALDKYVTQLQQEPGSLPVLRKLFKLVRAMKPKPRIPFEAATGAEAAAEDLKKAKTPDQFSAAAREFQKALLAAPWVASWYDGLSRAQEKGGDPKNALANLKIYLEAEPKAPKAARKRLESLKKAAGAETGISASTETQKNQMVPWPKATYTAAVVYTPAQGAPAQNAFQVSLSQTGNVITANKTLNSTEIPFLRGTVLNPAVTTWQYYVGDALPGACRSGWVVAAVAVSPDRRVLSFRQPEYMINHCDQDAGYDDISLTRN